MRYFIITEDALNHLKNHDKKIKYLIDKYGIIKREIEEDLYSSLVFSIISQQISTKAAKTVKIRLVDLVKEVNPYNINNVSDESLKDIGLSYRKVNYIKELTKLVINKQLDLDKIKTLPNEDVIKELIKVKGIGVWTAEMFLIFSLERQNVISYLDLAIVKAIKKLYNKETLSKEEFKQITKSYTPYESIASLYLWKYSNEF